MHAGAVRGCGGDAAGAHRGRLYGGRPLRAAAGHPRRPRGPAGVRDSGPQRLSHPKQVGVAGVAERQACALAGMLSTYGNNHLMRHDLICYSSDKCQCSSEITCLSSILIARCWPAKLKPWPELQGDITHRVVDYKHED